MDVLLDLILEDINPWFLEAFSVKWYCYSSGVALEEAPSLATVWEGERGSLLG